MNEDPRIEIPVMLVTNYDTENVRPRKWTSMKCGFVDDP